MNYGAEIWGFKDYAVCNNVQVKAMKYFLGVPKGAPNVGVQGEFGWLKPRHERWLQMCRYWNRLINVDKSHILYKVFEYDYNKCKKNWSSDMKSIFSELSLSELFSNKKLLSLQFVENKLFELYSINWKNEVVTFKKLRTFVTFKKHFKEEKYLLAHLSRRERSLLAQLRLGILPLRLETGRYKGEKEEDRICMLCNNNEIENETHFLFDCPLYDIERGCLYTKITDKCPNFEHLNTHEKLNILMSEFVYQTSKYINEAFTKRRNTLYK